MCIVTRRVEPVDALIRFVAAPDGSVVADLRRRLPGRGVWVTADAEAIRTAERKRLFNRGLGEDVVAGPGLADRVEQGLSDAALGALSLARKAGALLVGFAKVEAAIGRDRVVALIHARDAAEDGVAKLAAAARARFGGSDEPAVIRCFTSEEMGLALGRSNVIHAALLAGPAGRNVMQRVQVLLRYRGGNRPESDASRRSSNALTDQTEASAGP
jgi:predicted RNA-binding protein YlxR (DUF448 family)